MGASAAGGQRDNVTTEPPRMPTVRLFLPRKRDATATPRAGADAPASLLRSIGGVRPGGAAASSGASTSSASSISTSSSSSSSRAIGAGRPAGAAGVTSAKSASVTSSSGVGASKLSSASSVGSAAASSSADRKPALPTAAKAASAAAARSKAEQELFEDLYADPKLSNALLCAITKKQPAVVLRELQKAFSEQKVLLRASTTAAIKGEKQRVRFEMVASQLVSINGNPVTGDPLFAITASRLAGDMPSYREVCRKLLGKI